MKIALVGLPSSGKSSIINSLVGKRLAQSGVCRTTTGVKIYPGLVSDDGVKFEIYDLPGIADIEETEYNFDKMIFDTIEKCNLVFWVSDIIKAFITNHEKKEFEKVKNYIDNLTLTKGVAIQFVILLSKVNENIITTEYATQPVNSIPLVELPDPRSSAQIVTNKAYDDFVTTRFKSFQNEHPKMDEDSIMDLIHDAWATQLVENDNLELEIEEDTTIHDIYQKNKISISFFRYRVIQCIR